MRRLKPSFPWNDNPEHPRYNPAGLVAALRAAACPMRASSTSMGWTDVHVRSSQAANAILSEYEFRANVEEFIANTDGRIWLDVPFIGYLLPKESAEG